MPRAARVLLPALSCLLAAPLLAGCTGDDDGGSGAPAFAAPPAADFREGTCALVADDLLTIGRVVRGLDGATAEPAVRTELQDAQRVLQGAAPAAEPDVRGPLDAVVGRTGVVRIALDAERYDPTVAEPLAASYRDLVDVCTHPASAVPSATPSAAAQG